MVANRQHHNLRRIKVANDRHIAEHIRIASVINLHSVRKFDNKAASFTTA